MTDEIPDCWKMPHFCLNSYSHIYIYNLCEDESISWVSQSHRIMCVEVTKSEHNLEDKTQIFC